MARQMFFTLKEAAERLGLDEQAVKDMANQGKLQQFRDRDQLMFKRDEVELLASADDTTADEAIDPGDSAGESGPIPLASNEDTESGFELQLGPDDTDQTNDAIEPGSSSTGTDAISLADEDPAPASPDASPTSGGTGTGLGQASGADETGVSVFDADELDDQADPTAQTQVNRSAVDDDEELALDNVGSGSGLLDLTRETDDTSLGAAELLDEIGPGGTGEGSLGGEGALEGSSGALDATQASQDPDTGSAGLETMESGTQIAMDQPEETAESGAALPSVVAVAEPYDPAASGFAAGMLIGAGAALVLGLIIIAAAIYGARSPVLDLMVGEPGADNAGTMLMIWCGGLIAGSFLLGIVGMLVGKAGAKRNRGSAEAAA